MVFSFSELEMKLGATIAGSVLSMLCWTRALFLSLRPSSSPSGASFRSNTTAVLKTSHTAPALFSLVATPRSSDPTCMTFSVPSPSNKWVL